MRTYFSAKAQRDLKSSNNLVREYISCGLGGNVYGAEGGYLCRMRIYFSTKAQRDLRGSSNNLARECISCGLGGNVYGAESHLKWIGIGTEPEVNLQGFPGSISIVRVILAQGPS